MFDDIRKRAMDVAGNSFMDAAETVMSTAISEDDRIDTARLITAIGCCRIYDYLMDSDDIPESKEKKFIDTIYGEAPALLNKVLSEKSLEEKDKETFPSIFTAVATASADAAFDRKDPVFASMYAAFTSALRTDDDAGYVLDSLFDTYRDDIEMIMGLLSVKECLWTALPFMVALLFFIFVIITRNIK